MAKRAKSLKILLISALALTPGAFGRPVKPAARAAAAKKPAAHQPVRAHVDAAQNKHGKAAKGTRVERAHAVPREQPGSRKHGTLRVQEEASSKGKVKAQAASKVQLHPPVRAESKAVSGESKPVRAEATPVVVAAKPVVPAAQAEETTVRHDRKHHLPAEPAAGAPNAPPSPDGSSKPADGADGSAEATAILFTKAGRLIMPPAMKGSHDILVHQNVMADQDGLERVQDDDDLNRMRGNKMLLPLPADAGLTVDDRLPENRRFARPWTVKFLEAVGKAHYARFHSLLQVNSAVRTVEFQQKLMRVNGNAAPAEGETASPHLTGQAVDLAKKGLSMTEVAWLRGYLLPLVQQGKIDVEEEFQQSCFHISVYRQYVPDAAPRREIMSRPVGGSVLAAAMR